MPQRQCDKDRLQQIGELVDGAFIGAVLCSKALCEFATVALAASFERDKVAQRDTAVAADAVEHDFALVEELI